MLAVAYSYKDYKLNEIKLWFGVKENQLGYYLVDKY